MDQLKTAAKSGEEANRKGISDEEAKAKSGCQFDDKGCADYVPNPPIKRPAQSPAATGLADRIRKTTSDPSMAANLQWYLDLDRQMLNKQADIAAVQKEIDKGGGDAAVLNAHKKSLENDLARSKADQVNVVQQMKDQSEKLKLTIDWNEAVSKMTMTARVSFIGGIAAILLGVATPTWAQQIPALTALPATLATSNPALASRRAALMQERTILHDEIDGLNAKCAAVAKGSAAATTCLKTQAELLAQLNTHIQESKDFNTAAQKATVVSTGPAPVPAGSPANMKFCAAKLKVSADERAIQQMNFGNDERSFEIFENVSKAQKLRFEEKALGALLDQGMEQRKQLLDWAKMA